MPRNSQKRTVSANGVGFIKAFEGFRGQPYEDATGVWTIGYGHTDGVTASSRQITEIEGAALLKSDLDSVYAPPVNALKLPLTQDEFDATVSFTYNLGVGMLDETHTFGSLLRARRWAAAADSMLEYDRAGDQVLEGLVRRRRAERDLFLGIKTPEG